MVPKPYPLSHCYENVVQKLICKARRLHPDTPLRAPNKYLNAKQVHTEIVLIFYLQVIAHVTVHETEQVITQVTVQVIVYVTVNMTVQVITQLIAQATEQMTVQVSKLCPDYANKSGKKNR